MAVLLILLFISVQVVGVMAAGESYRNLNIGSRGNDVVKLQTELKNRGMYNSVVDGIYGRITRAAVVSFQKASGIAVDGIAGPQTQSTLYAKKVTVSRSASTRNYTNDDLYWLARIIHAEAGAEPYQGKVAVGNVVLNRVQSNSFPNTIYNVIFEYYHNIPQFSPVADGTIYNTPSQESIGAAKEALNGARPVGRSTYFFNPDKASGSWIVKNKAYVTKIGGHVFYQ